jgi:peptidoglycan/xylan/chitin deacetylase (PgdA/CDA1 family)
MAVNNVNYNDSLREGTDKINQSIDQSNNAIKKATDADAKSDSAVQTANLANTKSDDTQQQLNNIVINNGESDAEVLQARGSYSVLNERLESTDAQLAHNADEIKHRVISKSTGEPFINFHDDDGSTDFLTKVKPIADAAGVKFSLAINTSLIGVTETNLTHMTLSELLNLQSEGHEIISHGDEHQAFNGKTETRIRGILENAINYMKENGLNGYNYFVYAGGTTYNNEPLGQDLTRQYHKLAYNTTGNLNINPFNNYSITRVEINGKTLEDLKARVDEAVTNNAYLVFYTHAWMDNLDTTVLSDLIAYIKSLSIKIVNCDEAYNHLSNSIDVGSGNNYFRIGKNGKFSTNALTDYVKYLGSSNTLDRDITFYENDKMTISLHFNGQNALPTGIGGHCITYRFSADATGIFGRQVFYQIGSKHAIYTRAYTSTGWTSWVSTAPILDTASLKTNINGSIQSYAFGDTYSKVNTTATGNPTTLYGLLKTVRIEGDDDVFSYQEFLPNGQTTKYMRRWDPTVSNWKAWALQ